MTPQSPCLPDIALCDFFQFLKIMRILKGCHFTRTDEIQNALLRELKDISKIIFEEFFFFQELEKVQASM